MIENFAGARWWKFDFHAHTPASRDTRWHGLIGSADELSPEAWLLQFMNAEIDCVAITDHNSGGWIDCLKTAYAGLESGGGSSFRELHLFPGVEITVNGGFHLLAVFDSAASGRDVKDLLAQVGFDGTTGDSDGVTKKSATEVVQLIAEAGALAIPAHVDSEKGLFRLTDDTKKLTLDANTARQVLRRTDIAAVEAIDPIWPKHQLIAEEKCSWADVAVLGSDCHNFRNGPQPGDRFSWVKMCDPPNLEGLRLALLDGAPLSVRRSDTEPGDPNHHPRLALEQIVIANHGHAGRGKPMTVRFSPWLSTLIGGRGTGKSTVIELLRMALDREPGSAGGGDNRHEPTGNFERIKRSLRDDTSIDVETEKDRARYKIQWRKNSPLSLQEEHEDGDWKPAEGTVRSRFPVRIISQKEVFALADEPGALVALIDETDAVQYADWDAQWKTLENRFLRLRTQMREMDVRLEERERLAGELEDVRRQLAVFEEGENKELLVRYQKLRRQRAVFDDRRQQIEHTVQLLRSTAEEIEPVDVDDSVFAGEDASSVEAIRLLEEAASEQRGAKANLDGVAARLAEYRQGWWDRVQGSSWAVDAGATETAYKDLVARLRDEGVEDPSAYGAFVQKRTDLERRLEGIESLRKRREELRQNSAEVLEELQQWRVELTARRQRFLQYVLDGNEYVRISVIPFGDDPVEAERSFRRAFGREDGRLDKDILFEKEDGQHGGLLGEMYRGPSSDPELRRSELCTKIDAVKRQVVAIRQGHTAKKRTKWFRNHVREMQPEQVDRLELWWPSDGLRVEYLSPGGTFASLKEGSPGQKSAAILAFILSYGDEPLVLDQPEDDLDNHLIYDLIVSQIRENKTRRQLIIATHNPNIVVNGDAEMVITMDHRGGQCVVVKDGSGCLQSEGVREEVCRVMEGGRKAFEERYRRIIGEARHV
jgi:hypothetical protein